MVYNALRRSRILILALLILIGYLTYHLKNRLPPPIQISEFDIVGARNSFINPIYEKWNYKKNAKSINKYEYLKDVPLESVCTAYFDELSKLYPGNPGPTIVDLEEIQGTKYDSTVFKKQKWVSARRRNKIISFRGSSGRMSQEDIIQIELDYAKTCQTVSQQERSVFNQFAHARVFGKCILGNQNRSSEQIQKLDVLGSKFEKKLYPWVSQEIPTFESWLGEMLKKGKIPVLDNVKFDAYQETQVFLKDWQSKSNGRGIVIPILPTSSRSIQVENIARLIKVLRGLKNTFPIQITHVGDLLDLEKKIIATAARTEVSRLPSSHKVYLDALGEKDHKFVSTTDFPKQKVWFVDLTPVKNKIKHPLVAKSSAYNSAQFVLALSTIFNSFEESLVLLSSSIPLAEQLEKTFFENKSYKEHGILLFKRPSYYTSKIRRFKPGFHELTNLIRQYMTPSQNDKDFFGLNLRNPEVESSNRVYEESFQNLLDPSVMVINKTKVLSGLLMGANFQLYDLFKLRFAPVEDDLNPEFVWIGQELAGTNVKVNFNHNYGVIAGILTPEENKSPVASSAIELCSSSWAQLSDVDDYTLLYVTSHQLENWIYEGMTFKENLKGKYAMKKTELVDNVFKPGEENNKVEVIKEDTTMFQEKVVANPLFIDTILRPPIIKKPIYTSEFQEPNQAWLKQDKFAGFSGHQYYCAYDVVGLPVTGERGLTISVNDKLQAWYKYVLDVWYHQDRMDEDIANQIVEQTEED